MTAAQQRLKHVLESIDQHAHGRPIQLVAVSKSRTVQEILPLYELGIRDFAESRLQEALGKIAQLPSDIRWHWIGRLQTNKLRSVAMHFHLIHSLDSLEHAQALSKIAQRPIAVLLQVNVSAESTKAGLSAAQWLGCFEQVLQLPLLRIEGLMTMAPHTEELKILRQCFADLKTLQQHLQILAQGRADMATLSMGMSEDYITAIQEGATMVRIGRALFDPAT